MGEKPKQLQKPVWPERGWYLDAEDPTSVRHWDGEAWGARAPRPGLEGRQPSAWRQSRVIALGILMAVAVVWAVWTFTAPSEVDCALNDVERALAATRGEPIPAKLSRCP